MPRPTQILSDWEHPTIVLSGTDDGRSEPILVAPSEAGESQGPSELHDESTPSATGDEQTPESSSVRNRSRSHPPRLEPGSSSTSRRQKLDNSRAVRTACRNLKSDFGGWTLDSGEAEWNQNDESEYGSSSSTYSSETHFDHQDQQVGLAGAGERFPEWDEPGPPLDINDESGLEDSNGGQASQTKASAAVIAPFRGTEGGLPILPEKHRQRKDPTDITDFGESLYSKARRARSRRSSFSIPPRDDGRRRTKTKKTLQDRLFRALVPTHESGKEFFPKKVLSAIVNRQCVYEELSKHLADSHSEEMINQYAKRICDKTEYIDDNGVRKTTRFLKIFVILVLIDKTPAITKFLEIGLSDKDLPLQYVARADKQSSRELRLSRDPEKRLKCFSKQWKQLHIRNFETYQWTTISPFFAKGEHKKVSFYKLKDQTILPFISINQNDGRSNARTLEFEGGFSRVFKVDIHPDHHNFEGDGEKQSKNKSFAVKGLHSRDREDFDKEVEMLKRFSDPSVPAHKHLISLLATYQHFGTYFLIFHWADADLRRYWKDVNPNPVMDRRTVKWVAQQCKGIAEGVCAIHQYTSSSLRPQPKNVTFGHHGDIKPENVLWFSEPNHEQTANGTLKLSDFGLAALSMHQTRSMQPKSKLATSLAYQAPEVDTDGTHAIGRSYDIWTLGCLYLEFITWLMGGWDLVGEFLFFRIPQDVELGQDGTTFYGSNQAPNFYVLNPVKIPGGKWNFTAEVKPAVSKFISRLLADAKCTDFLRDFIEMIRDDLLVIKANNRQKLDGDRDRATSREVLTRLSKMLRNCENVSGYGY